MNLALLAAGLLGLLSSMQRKTPAPPKPTAILDLIRKAADDASIPRDIAVATAYVESKLNPRAKGDLDWWKNTARFAAKVPADNPYRAEPELWHSYGLFGLMAAYHVRPGEHPHVLYDPNVNAARGTAALARYLREENGDYDRVRLRYTGAVRAAPDYQAKVLSRWHNALDGVRKGGLV